MSHTVVFSQVQSEVERVILFLLSKRVGEKLPEEETVFSPHPRMEMSKILWLNKEAVGFYTVKQKGVTLVWTCTQGFQMTHGPGVTSNVIHENE